VTDCDEIRTALGGYALDALEPEETRTVAEHLANCESCRNELEQLSFASALLRTPQARTLAAEPEAEPATEAALAAIAQARGHERRRLRRLGIGTLAASTAFLVALGAAATLATRPVDSFPPGGVATPLRPAAGIAAAGSVQLSSRPWGTQVDLVTSRMPALPAGTYYELWLVRADGSRVAAGTFRPTTPGGRARVRLAAALPLREIARIGVTRHGRGDGIPILSSPRSRTT